MSDVLHQVPNIRQFARDRRRRRHARRHQVRASAPALTAFKVAVGGCGTAFARFQLIGVHRQTHGTAREAPFKACFLKDVRQTFFFGLRADKAGAGDDHGAFDFDLFAFEDLSSGAQVFDTTVGARADKDRVDFHIRQRGPCNRASAGRRRLCRLQNRSPQGHWR